MSRFRTVSVVFLALPLLAPAAADAGQGPSSPAIPVSGVGFDVQNKTRVPASGDAALRTRLTHRRAELSVRPLGCR